MRSHINMIITNVCNLKCKHCFLDCTQSGNFASFENIKSVAKKFYDMGFSEISITGGECSTHPQLNEIIDYLKEIGYTVKIFTNCFTLNEKIIDMIDGIFVSLDGTKDYHDAFRGKKGSYDSVINVLDYCQKISKKASIQTSITIENLHLLKDLLQIYRKYKSILSTIYLSAIANEGRGCNLPDTNPILEEIEKETKIIQKDVGFDIKVVNNIYRGKLSNAYFGKNYEPSLWVDLTDMSCYHIKKYDMINVNDYDLIWDEKQTFLIKSKLCKMDLPNYYTIDSALSKIL